MHLHKDLLSAGVGVGHARVLDDDDLAVKEGLGGQHGDISHPQEVVQRLLGVVHDLPVVGEHHHAKHDGGGDRHEEGHAQAEDVGAFAHPGSVQGGVAFRQLIALALVFEATCFKVWNQEIQKEFLGNESLKERGEYLGTCVKQEDM